eukprot:gene1250-11339_t
MKRGGNNDDIVALGERKKTSNKRTLDLDDGKNISEVACEDVVKDVLKFHEQNLIQERDKIILSTIDFLVKKTGSPSLQKYYYISLIMLAKKYNQVFASDKVVTRLISLLHTYQVGNLNTKKSTSMALLSIHVLENLFENNFPIEFVQCWIEDSLGEKIWVEHPFAKNFIDKILKIFEKQDSRESIQILLFEIQKNGDKTSIKNLIKLLDSVIHLKEVRLYASKNMENWLNHPSAIKLVWDLLSKISNVMNGDTEEDLETISNLIQMKVKSSHSQEHSDSIQKLMMNNQLYSIVSLRKLIQLEIKQSRPTNYSKLILSVFKTMNENREEELGKIMQEMASDQSNQQLIRPFIRRLIKILHSDLNLEKYCSGLMTKRIEMINQNEELKQNWIGILCDMITMSCLNFIILTSKNDEIQLKYQLANIHSNCLQWCENIIPDYLDNFNQSSFMMISFILFLQPMNVYFQNENFIDSEKQSFSNFCSSIPLKENTLTSLISMSLNGNLISKEHCLELIYKMVYRAALLNQSNCLECNNENIILSLFHLTEYKENSKFENIYIKKFFWDFITISTIITCFNPISLGSFIWNIPCVKLFLEVLIKNQFHLPNDLKEDETLLKKEKEEITSFCFEMSQTTDIEIFKDKNVSNFFLKLESDLYSFKLPNQDYLTNLQNLNRELFLGNYLRACRKPDFLFLVMKEEESEKSLVWLTEILEKESNTLNILPISMICDLLLTTDKFENQESNLVLNLIQKLNQWLFSSNQNESLEVFNFFLKKFVDENSIIRKKSNSSFKKILSKIQSYSENMVSNWMEKIIEISCFEISKNLIFETLKKLVQFGTDLNFISEFIEFVYECKICEPFSILMLISDLFSNRKYFSKKFLNHQNHKFCQMIFLESFKTIQLQDSSIEKVELTFGSGSDEEEIKEIPKKYIEGILNFVTFPIGISKNLSKHFIENEFDDPFIDLCSDILNSYNLNEKSKVMNETVAKNIMFSSNEKLLLKSIQILSLKDRIKLLTNFGISQSAISLLFESLKEIRDEDILVILKETPKIKNISSMEFESEGCKRIKNLIINHLNENVKEEISIVSLQFNKNEQDLMIEENDEENRNKTPKDLLGNILNGKLEQFTNLILENQQEIMLELLKEILMLLSSNEIPKLNSIYFVALLKYFDKLSKKSETIEVEYLKLINDISLSLNSFDENLKYFLSLFLKKVSSNDHLFQLFPQLKSSNDLKIVPLNSTFNLIGQTKIENNIESKIDLISSLSKIGSSITEVILIDLIEQNEKEDEKFILKNLFSNFLIEREEKEREEKRRKLVDENLNLSNIRNHGIIFDYLFRMDPSISSDFLRNFIFKFENKNEELLNSKERKYLIPFLITLLKQNSNEKIQQEIVEKILNLNDYSSLDFKSSLDFIHSCSDKSRFLFTNQFSLEVCQFLKKELKLFLKRNFDKKERINEFIELNLNNIEIFLETLKENLTFIIDKLKKDEEEKDLNIEILSWIYSFYPEKISLMNDQQIISPSIKFSFPTKFDSKIHSLFSLLNEKEEIFSNFGYNLLKNYSILYPELMMKNVGSLCSLLEDSNENLKIEKLKNVYFKVLEILRHLIPFLFKTNLFLDLIIPKYFQMMKNLKKEEKFQNVFIEFLFKYLKYCSKEEVKLFLNSFKNIESYFNLKNLKSFKDLLFYLNHFDLMISKEDDFRSDEKLKISILEISKISQNLNCFSSNFEMNAFEYNLKNRDCLITLNELQILSNEFPEITEYFQLELLNLILKNNLNIRSISYSLILNILNENPKQYSKIIPFYLNCLKSSNFEIQKSAIEHSFEFYPFTMEYSDELIKILFKIGTSLSNESLKNIFFVKTKLSK